jgi:hypothetical protein
MQKEDTQAKYMDNQPKGANLPFMKPEDAQYFDKLLVKLPNIFNGSCVLILDLSLGGR